MPTCVKSRLSLCSPRRMAQNSASHSVGYLFKESVIYFGYGIIGKPNAGIFVNRNAEGKIIIGTACVAGE